MRALARFALIVTCAAVGATTAAAQPTVKTVTLKAPDGIKLVGTYYAAAQPGPGLLLLHQCNRELRP